MAGHKLIDDYLDEVAGRLRWRTDIDSITDELRDHLYCAVDRRTAAGIPPTAAQAETLSNFGSPGDIAMDFAAAGTNGVAVPTSFTVTAGRLARLAAIGWIVAAALMVASELADRASGTWEGPPQGFFIAGWNALMLSAALSAAVTVAMVRRHGGLGILGLVGIGLAGLGTVASLVGWFFVGWGGLIGLGALLIAVAGLRRNIAPRGPTIAFGASWLIAGVIAAALRVLEVGGADQWGDYRVALLAGLVVGCAGFAIGLIGLGRWLAGEEAVSDDAIRSMARADGTDHA